MNGKRWFLTGRQHRRIGLIIRNSAFIIPPIAPRHPKALIVAVLTAG